MFVVECSGSSFWSRNETITAIINTAKGTTMRLASAVAAASLLFASSSLAQTRIEILDAQIYLNGLGYDAGAPDGVWGRNTASALNAFLRDQGLVTTEVLTDFHVSLLNTVVKDLGVPLTAVRLSNGRPYDPLWPEAEWHPEMMYDPEHNAGRGGFTRDGWNSSATVLPHQFNLVSSPFPVRYGSHSERFEIRPNDDSGMYPPTSGNRSELTQRPHPNNGSIGDDNWYGWSFYHENLLSVDYTYNWAPFLGQWKTDFDAAPVIAIQPAHDGRPMDGQFMGVSLVDLSEGRDRAWLRANYFGVPCRLFRIAEAQNQWIDIVINTNFAADESGYLNIWINGEQKCQYRGQITVTPVDEFQSYGVINDGPIFKRGYWSGHRNFPSRWLENHPHVEIPTFVIYYDEWRQGSSREEVDIRMIEARGGEPVD